MIKRDEAPIGTVDPGKLFGELPRPSTPTHFNAYLIVDWSARSERATGKDSVWWCLCEWGHEALHVRQIENPPTREAAFDSIRAALLKLAADGKRVLVGFDFPYGYPAGLASKLGLDGTPWRAVWNQLVCLIKDDQAARHNNRFCLANDWNRRIGAEEGPFWGHPQGRTFRNLRPTAPASYPVKELQERRIAERYARSAQPVWKLFGNGSVGSQALLGIPCVARLRDDDFLSEVSAVWPFETGCTLPDRQEGPQIVHAEIYPSLVKLPSDLMGRVKDSVQVELLARHFARHDGEGRLAALFEAPAALGSEDVADVVSEEGWILGLTVP